MAQSIFQIDGNIGSAIGPLIAAVIILPFGRSNVGAVALVTLVAMLTMFRVPLWCRRQHSSSAARRRACDVRQDFLSPSVVMRAMVVLLVLLFSKYFYLASLSSYYTFYLMERFHVAPQAAQLYLFLFLFAAAAGTLMGASAASNPSVA